MAETRVDASANTRADASGNTRVTTTGFPLSDDLLTLMDASVGAAHRAAGSEVVYILRLQPYNLATGGFVNLYFGSTTFRTDGTDLPANTIMPGRFVPPNVRVSLWQSGKVGSGAPVVRGVMKIINPREKWRDRNGVATEGRGRFDELRADYSWMGHTWTVYIGAEDGAFTTFEEYQSGTIAKWEWDLEEIRITPAPALTDWDLPVQDEFYGQGYEVLEDSGPESKGPRISYYGLNDSKASFDDDNTGKGARDRAKTLQGIPTIYNDLTGIPRPLAYGHVYGVEPTRISKSHEIWQFHSIEELPGGDACESVEAVYENGLAFSAGEPFVPIIVKGSITDTAKDPGVGSATADYYTNLVQSTITLDDATEGIITADIKGARAGDWGAYVDRAGDLTRVLAYVHMGLDPKHVDTASLAQFDAEWDYETGIFPAGMNRKAALSKLLPYPYFWYVARDGRLKASWLKNPSEATADLTISENDISGVRLLATIDPLWRVRVGYQPVGKVISLNDFAGAVTDAEYARQSQEYRYVEATDVSIGEFYKAGELEILTQLASKADAQALADYVLKLRQVQRYVLEVGLLRKYLRYDLSMIIRLGLNRYDFIDDGDILLETGDSLLLESGDKLLKEEHADGTNFQCIGYVDNPPDPSAQWAAIVWG